MGGSPPRPVSGIARDIRAAFVGWILFNLLMLLIYLGYQRYTQLDTWKWREPLARWATFDTWIVWPDIVGPQEVLMAGRNRATLRMDTDGDGFKEWVVKYQYDMANPLPQAENIPYVDASGNTYFGAIVHVAFFYTLKNDPKQEKRMHSVNWFVIREKGNWRLDHVEP